MTVPEVRITEFSDRPDKPLVVLGPSLGTSVQTLWGHVADLLADRFHVVGWDLPGHGLDIGAQHLQSFSVRELSEGVVRAVETVLERRGEAGGSFCYAGVSAGGAVGLELLLRVPTRLDAAALLCTGAQIGDPDTWRERAAVVREGGTAAMVDGSVQRWFAPGFTARQPDVSGGLLGALRATGDEGYALTCEALAAFDVRDRLGEISSPVLAISGDSDTVTPSDGLERIATGVRNGQLAVLDNVAHLAPSEAPHMTAQLLSSHFTAGTTKSVGDRYNSGMKVRREVLGDTHVDRATSAATDFTREFQEFITQYAWGEIWSRPGLDRRSRSMITLTAMISGGHHEELAMHVRAAITNGLTTDEIKEVLLQSAIYCGVPAANTAFKIAGSVLEESMDCNGRQEMPEARTRG